MATISASPGSATGSIRGSVTLPAIPPSWRRPAPECLTRTEADAPTVVVEQARSARRLFTAGVAVFLLTLALSGVMATAGARVATVLPAQTAPVAAVESAALPAWTVSSGDTLWSVAIALDADSDPRATVAELRRLNGLTPDHVLQVGEVLLVPTG